MKGFYEFLLDKMISDAEKTNTPIKDVLDSVEINGFKGTITWDLKINEDI